MTTRSVRIRVLDIIGAIDAIEQFLDQKDFEIYQSSIITKRATERCLEIISEASRHIPDEIQARYPEIPWAKIRGIGNVLRHEYSRVQDSVLWYVAEDSLPDLKRALTEILASLPDEPDD